MARTVPQHKAQYTQFIDPHYAMTPVDPGKARRLFQSFQDTCMTDVPDEGAPADPYMYASHMGAFVRSLDEAKDHYVKGLMAFYAKRGSSTD